MRNRLIPLVLAGLVSGTASAAPESYNIDPSHTFPSFEVNHLGFSTQRGRFNTSGGRIVLDRAKGTAQVEINIEAGSIDTGYAKLEEHLKAADFFDVAKFPLITFKSTDAKFNGDKLVSLAGNLTMHGITKPITLTVTAFNCAPHPMTKKDACGANAVATLKRSDFGINYGIPAVGDEVQLMIQVEAFKQ